jgi:transposase-like protein
MGAGTDRSYTDEFRDAGVKQVTESGRSLSAVARSLEMSNKTLANWVLRSRKGQSLIKRVLPSTFLLIAVANMISEGIPSRHSSHGRPWREPG